MVVLLTMQSLYLSVSRCMLPNTNNEEYSEFAVNIHPVSINQSQYFKIMSRYQKMFIVKILTAFEWLLILWKWTLLNQLCDWPIWVIMVAHKFHFCSCGSTFLYSSSKQMAVTYLELTFQINSSSIIKILQSSYTCDAMWSLVMSVHRLCEKLDSCYDTFIH